ncbi:MAG TPA: hypothetical protein VHG29_08275 [Novosphingobium sp.]|nr:hypothetical protein [Novosphingobium sp.]
MRKSFSHIFAAAASLAFALPAPVMAQNVDFGDDASRFSKDGECDDMRFSGAGMTSTTLIDSDIRHDATDCRSAYNQGRLTYQGGQRAAPASTGYADSGVNHIMWGDDASQFSRDGECDDKRFIGAGMTSTILIDSDIKHDATDCRTAYNQGRLTLRQ